MAQTILQDEPRTKSTSLPRVCVLDDDESVVEMLVESLGQLGYSASGTDDPEVALEQISKGSCRIVLCDIQMPKMNGLAFLEAALRRDPGVYVILMAAQYS